MIPEYEYTKDKNAPAVIRLGDYVTPVWIQQSWTQGEYAQYVRKNGCGHCCTAMALNLNGIKITPHEEFALCRKLWGEPRMWEPYNEDNFMSANGIAEIIKSFGINAMCFGVPKGKADECVAHIEKSLKNGKTVIFWSHPGESFKDNPFSPGDHYVLAVGIDDSGILIANSSERSGAVNGIQHTDLKTIAKSLWEGCAPCKFTWGRGDLLQSSGYVVVG